MATLEDLGVSAFINIVGAFIFLLLFAVLRIQPINDRVYFPKLYIAKKRSHDHRGARRAINLNLCTYFKFLSWVPGALRMNQTELIHHAGLDSVHMWRRGRLPPHAICHRSPTPSDDDWATKLKRNWRSRRSRSSRTPLSNQEATEVRQRKEDVRWVVHQVRAYEDFQQEAVIRHVKTERIELK